MTLVDARPAVDEADRSGHCRPGLAGRDGAADVFDWLASAPGREDLVLSNLFVHHFEGADLARLMRGLAARARLFVATEPLRTRLSLAASGLVGAIGANAVTRHDAPASVRAGFRGGELSALWPGAARFEGRRGVFTHAFVGAG